MSGVSRAFSREGPVDAEAVAAALRPTFTVTAGAEQTVSHTWLDTFDWRLHSAGISLQSRRRRAVGHADFPTASGCRPRWPG